MLYEPDSVEPTMDMDSQAATQDAHETDLSQPMIAYTDDSGEERQLTGSDVLDRIGRMRELEEQNSKLSEQAKLMEMLQPLLGKAQPQEAAQPAQPAPASVNWGEVGQKLAEMLEGEHGGPNAIGPELQAVVAQEAARILSEQQAVQQAVSSFKGEFADFEKALSDGRVEQFRRSNPHYNPAEAYLVLHARELRAEVERLKAQVGEARSEGKKEGEAETVKNLKAKGSIRLLGSQGGRPQSGNIGGKHDLSDPEGRANAMRERLAQMRASSV